MKRITTLLALVALVLVLLALQSFQHPANVVPRHALTRTEGGHVIAGTRERDTANQPVLRVANIPHDVPKTTGAPSCGPQRPLEGSTAGNPAVGILDPENDNGESGSGTTRDGTSDDPANEVLTPEERELRQKRDKGNGSLNWLRDHQCEDGRWSAADFGAASTRKEARHAFNLEFVAPGLEWGDKGQSPENDLALTALVLLGHIGAGYDHKEGEYKQNVRKAIIWLRKQQHESGRFGEERDNAFLPTHALCTAAMAECYSISGDAALKANCENAAKYLLTLQTENSGFARIPNGYGLEAEADMATTAWSALALKSAKIAGFELDLAACGKGLCAFLEKVTTVNRELGDGGKIVSVSTRQRVHGGDAPDGRQSGFLELPTLNAMNAFVRGMFGPYEVDNKEIAVALAQSAASAVPQWEDGRVDFTHWYFTTAAAFQWFSSPRKNFSGGKSWSDWEKAIGKALLNNQRGYKAEELKTWPAMLDEFGSWDAVDAYSHQGGRVYTTAMACLTLQIYYRYKRQTKD